MDYYDKMINKTFEGVRPDLKEQFLSLVSRLSPENLHCDGEISMAEAKRKYRVIMSEWESLENQAGKKIDPHELV